MPQLGPINYQILCTLALCFERLFGKRHWKDILSCYHIYYQFHKKKMSQGGSIIF